MICHAVLTLKWPLRNHKIRAKLLICCHEWLGLRVHCVYNEMWIQGMQTPTTDCISMLLLAFSKSRRASQNHSCRFPTLAPVWWIRTAVNYWQCLTPVLHICMTDTTSLPVVIHKNDSEKTKMFLLWRRKSVLTMDISIRIPLRYIWNRNRLQIRSS